MSDISTELYHKIIADGLIPCENEDCNCFFHSLSDLKRHRFEHHNRKGYYYRPSYRRRRVEQVDPQRRFRIKRKRVVNHV